MIPRNIEILPKSCFAQSKLESIIFENESRLTRIKDSCFFNCSLKSICIPQHVEILPKSCFAGEGFWRPNAFESITFENESRLTRIEDSCFRFSRLREIFIPSSVQHIAENAFDHQVTVIRNISESIAGDGLIALRSIVESILYDDGSDIDADELNRVTWRLLHTLLHPDTE
jgi:hypothetical protein